MVKWVYGGGRVAQQQRPLPEVVEHQAGQRHAEPGHLNRAMAEVTEVRVQRLTPGNHEKDGAQHHEAPVYILGEEAYGVVWRDRGQHAGLLENLAQPEPADRGEPDEHHRAEHGPDPSGSAALQQEQADQDHERHGDHPRGQRRGRDLESLHGAQHGDGWRQGAVRVQQRRPEDPQDDHHAAGRQPSTQTAAVDERHEGEHAALTLVVGPDYDDVILYWDNDDQRTENER